MTGELPDVGGGPADGAAPRRRPRWAAWCAAVGTVLVLLSGGLLVAVDALRHRYESAVTTADLFGDERERRARAAADLTGRSLDILLVGIDPRPSMPNWVPRADSVLILHVDAGLERAYLFSLPRDLIVDVPAFPGTGYAGDRTKLAHAMFYGSRVPGAATPDAAMGFTLLAQTVSRYTGITDFDAGAIINFTGFKKIVDAMGGVDLYVDQRVVSAHMRPDGRHRAPNPHGAGYVGPQKVYEKGRAHLSGWEALDYVRQRYIPGGDYARQRHQQQFIKAMVQQATSRDVLTDPARLDAVLRAAGEALTFNGRGHSIVDFAFALRDLGPGAITMIKLPGHSIVDGGGYVGEELEPIAGEFFLALRTGGVDAFVAAHPELVNADA